MRSNFITNDQEGNLEDRISKLIGFSQELKFLVGFFLFLRHKPALRIFENQSRRQVKRPSGIKC